MSSATKLERARRALLEALGPELGPAFERNAPDLILFMARAMTDGLYTAKDAAEAMTVCNELADATERGDITEALGMQLVELDATRQVGRRRAD